jgi:phosphatidylethanolamine/phosphatidyl-N-methylethanolamine N-methyltransferase
MREACRVLKKGGRIMVMDKFSPEKEPGLLRRALNIFTSLIGTDITRNFADISKGIKFKVLKDEAGIFGGNYRTIIIKK